MCPAVAELFFADRQTNRQADMTKLIVAFAMFRKHLITLNTVYGPSLRYVDTQE